MRHFLNMIYGNRFFEDEPTGGGNPPAGGDPKGGEGNPDLKKLQDRISYLDGELKKVIGDRDTLKGKLREIDDAEALKKGEYEKLINDSKTKLSEVEKELGTYKSKAESWDKYKTSKQESLKERIGDKWKDSYASLPLEDLEELSETLAPKNATDLDNGKPKGGNGKVNLTEEEKAMAKSRGLSEEDFAKVLARQKEIKQNKVNW